MRDQNGRDGRKRAQSGSNVLEFALVITPLVGLLIGIANVGLALGTSVRVTQVCRDAASMYSRGVDFSQSGNQDILVRLAEGLGLARSGGNGVVIFTQVTWISQAKCTEMGLSACNGNQHVMLQRIVVGNSSLYTSSVGTPTAGSTDSKGLIANYMTDPGARAQVSPMTLNENQLAYVTETYFFSPIDGKSIYLRSIF